MIIDSARKKTNTRTMHTAVARVARSEEQREECTHECEMAKEITWSMLFSFIGIYKRRLQRENGAFGAFAFVQLSVAINPITFSSLAV